MTRVSERAIDKDCIHGSRGEEKTKSKAGLTSWSGAVILCHILKRLDNSEKQYLRIQSDNMFIRFNNSKDINIICWTSKEEEYPPTPGRRTFHLQKGKFWCVFLWAKASAFLAKTLAQPGFLFFLGGWGTNIYMII